MMNEAALEGVQAFIDKRPPRWKQEGIGETAKRRESGL